MRKLVVNKGFSLIELMIVIAIISITLMIAVPAYSSFTTRAKVTELIGATAPYRISISEYLATKGKLPDPEADSGFEVVRKPSTMIQHIRVRLPVETVIFVEVRPSDNISSELQRIQAVVLRGKLLEGSRIEWDCGVYSWKSQAMPLKYLPASCRQILHFRGKF